MGIRILTGRFVVTYSEIWINVTRSSGQPIFAVLGIAADFLRGKPNNLREVAPFSKIAHIGLLTISRIEIDLVPIHLVADHTRNLRVGGTCANVLTVPAATSGGIVPIHTRDSNRLCYRGQVIRLSKARRGVSDPMGVVCLQDVIDIVAYQSCRSIGGFKCRFCR